MRISIHTIPTTTEKSKFLKMWQVPTLSGSRVQGNPDEVTHALPHAGDMIVIDGFFFRVTFVKWIAIPSSYIESGANPRHMPDRLEPQAIYVEHDAGLQALMTT